MKAKTIEVTFRNGRPFAAHLRLEGTRGACVRTREVTASLLVDLDERGHALGIEILAFDGATIAQINDVLASLGHPPLSPAELAPLRAA